MKDPRPPGRLLTEPFCVLDSDYALEWTFRVTGYERGSVYVRPRGEASPLVLPALRIYTAWEDQPDGPGYWDITSRQLRSMLAPILETLIETGRPVRVLGAGRRPRITFTVDVLP